MKRLVLGAVTAVASCSSLVAMVGGSSAAAPPATVVSSPLMRAGHTPQSTASGCSAPCQSTNWAGYAQVSKRRTYTEVVDTFIAPTVDTGADAPAGTQYAADWVGIGGFNDPSLVQAGIQVTVQTTDGTDGTSKTTWSYDAWTEILPQVEKPLDGVVISPGDTVTVTVEETARNRWLMQVQDGKQIGSRLVTYHSSGRSVEAIHERPCVQSPCSTVGDLATLAQTSNVTFVPGTFSTARPGLPPAPESLLTTGNGAKLYDVTMVGNDETTPIATPSAPSDPHDGFTVADGSTVPPAPST